MGQETHSLGKALEGEKIGRLALKPACFIRRGTSTRQVISVMRKKRTGCILITDNDQVVGIFSERDLLTRVIEARANLDKPIEAFMTSDPEVLSVEDTIGDAIQLMHSGGYRHIPIRGAVEKGKPQKIIGMLSVRDLVRYFGSNFPAEVYNLPPEPRQAQRAREGA